MCVAGGAGPRVFALHCVSMTILLLSPSMQRGCMGISFFSPALRRASPSFDDFHDHAPVVGGRQVQLLY
jgi:hypothetical protein